MDKDLLKLFDINEDYFGYFHLIGTDFMYAHREERRWMAGAGFDFHYVSFEYVLDNVSEEIQTQFLFHLDYFLGEVIDG